MIADIKEKIEPSFLHFFSWDTGIGKWNKEKLSFNFVLEPWMLEPYAEVVGMTTDGWNHDGVEVTFFDKLDFLQKLGVISSYSRDPFFQGSLDSARDKKWDLEEHYNEFENICREKCGEYTVYVDYKKLKLFEEILYNTNSLELNISKRLLKTIMAFYLGDKYSDIDVFSEKPPVGKGYEPDLFDMEIIIDEIHIHDKEYIFNDFELLLYALAINKTKEHMAQLLAYLLEGVSGEQKSILVKILKKEGVFHYYTDEEIDHSDKVLSGEIPFGDVIEDRMMGNLGYYLEKQVEKKVHKTEEGNNSIISYNFKTKILDYNGKKISFVDSAIQAHLIEELYKDLGQWVTKSELHKKGFRSGLKATKDNIFKNNFKNLTAVEKKKLINFFTANKEEYIMMVGLEK